MVVTCMVVWFVWVYHTTTCATHETTLVVSAVNTRALFYCYCFVAIPSTPFALYCFIVEDTFPVCRSNLKLDYCLNLFWSGNIFRRVDQFSGRSKCCSWRYRFATCKFSFPMSVSTTDWFLKFNSKMAKLSPLWCNFLHPSIRYTRLLLFLKLLALGLRPCAGFTQILGFSRDKDTRNDLSAVTANLSRRVIGKCVRIYARRGTSRVSDGSAMSTAPVTPLYSARVEFPPSKCIVHS